VEHEAIPGKCEPSTRCVTGICEFGEAWTQAACALRTIKAARASTALAAWFRAVAAFVVRVVAIVASAWPALDQR